MSIHSSSRKFRVAMTGLGREGFTLTEILIVIGIIVLLIAVAVPTLNSLSGGKSVEGAQNKLASLLGRARAEAIGLQQPRGVCCYLDVNTSRSVLAVVHQPYVDGSSSVFTTAANYSAHSYVLVPGTPTRYFVSKIDLTMPAPVPPASGGDDGNWAETDAYAVDAVDDIDLLQLPPGVGMQLVNDCQFAAGARTTNGYVNYGAIMFNPAGQVVSRRVSIAYYGRVGQHSKLTENAPYAGTGGAPLYSQLGLVMYDLDSYTNNGGTQAAQSVLSSMPANYTTVEKNQEAWLDNNATPLMINRYSGAIVKGE